MDDAQKRRLETMVSAGLRGEIDRDAADWPEWIVAKAMLRGSGEAERHSLLRVAWLEHRASELEAEADKLEEAADYTAVDRLLEEAQGHRGSAKAIRRHLLGEVVDG